jgi:hypothetical protein
VKYKKKECTMTSLFAITTTLTNLSLDANRHAAATFTVFNASGQPIRGRARLFTTNSAMGPWLSLAGEGEQDLPVAGTAQYTVQIAPPASAPAGQYSFRLDMVDVEHPDERYTEGPAVTFEVLPVTIKPFPWWILALAGGVIVVGVVVALLVWPRKVHMPQVLGLSLIDARSTVTAEGLQVGGTAIVSRNDVTPGYVVASSPEADTIVTPGSTVVLVVAAAPTATPTPTSTPAPTSTPTATLIPEPTDTPTATPTPTHVPGTVMEDFVGDWVNVQSDDNTLTRLTVQKVNNTILAIDGYSRIFSKEVPWGTVKVPFTPNKVIATYEFSDTTGVYLKETVALERSGALLLAEVFYDFSAADGRPDKTLNYQLKAQRVRVDRPFVVTVAIPRLPVIPFEIVTPTP